MDMGLIQGAINGLSTASNIARTMLDLQVSTEVRNKVIELQSAILVAQSLALSANAQHFAVVEEIRELKEEAMKAKNWDREKKRYKLVNLNPLGFAYANKKLVKNSEPPHHICTKCYEDGRRSILNIQHDANQWCKYVCPHCLSEIHSVTGSAFELAYAPD